MTESVKRMLLMKFDRNRIHQVSGREFDAEFIDERRSHDNSWAARLWQKPALHYSQTWRIGEETIFLWNKILFAKTGRTRYYTGVRKSQFLNLHIAKIMHNCEKTTSFYIIIQKLLIQLNRCSFCRLSRIFNVRLSNANLIFFSTHATWSSAMGGVRHTADILEFYV